MIKAPKPNQTAVAPGRVPPHSVEAEEQLLSACLLDGRDVVAKAVNAGISPDSFYVPANRVIFSTVQGMFAEGKEIDLAVLGEELRTARLLGEIGGYAYLTCVSSRIPTTAGAAYFIEKVRELALLREVIAACTGGVEAAYNYTGEPLSELLSPFVNRLMEVQAGGVHKAEKSWDAVITSAEKDLRAKIESKGKPDPKREIPFPWQRMNELFGPMQRGQLVVVAARASVGKSSLARPLLQAATDHGHNAYYVTLEVDPRMIPLQIAASMSGIGLRQAPFAHQADQKSLLDALRALRGRGVTISSKDRTIAKIEARARALHAKGQIDILFVDHGGLVQDVYAAEQGEKVGACGRLTKTLKQLADELSIVVVLLWQLNRASVQQSNREPNLTDLKDSGSLEEDADKVLLIHRPDKDGFTNMDQDTTKSAAECPRFFQNVIQAKGRDDGTALLSFYFHRETATFIPAVAR